MWECSGEERMDVRQRSRVVGGVLCLSRARQFKHGKGCGSAMEIQKWMRGRHQGLGESKVVEKVLVQIFQHNRL